MNLRSLGLLTAAVAIGLSLCSSIAGAQAAPATLRPITIDDYFQVREVADPQISADGRWIAYTVSTASLKDDDNKTRIWMVATAGGDPIAMTSEEESSEHPRWSPDGKYLAFLSKRDDGKTYVWLLNRMGGEAEPLTETVQDVKDFAWSPDSKRIVLVLQDPSPEDLEAAKERAQEKSQGKATKEKKPKAQRPWVVDRYIFKEDEIGYLERLRTHLYVFDIGSKTLTQVTSGDFDDLHPAWSPDGKFLAFSSKRTGPDPDRNYDSNIFVVAADNADKGAHLTQITTNPGSDDSPAWSPDGKWIAYATQLDPKLLVYATSHIAVSPSTGGEAKVLTLNLDRMSTEPHFSPDSKFIYFIADDDGTQNLCRVPVGGGEITRPISGRLMLYAYSVAPTGDVAAQITTTDRPSEIFTIPGGKLTRITHTNDAFLSQVKLVAPEYVKFKSKDGTTVSGYLYKPIDYVPGKKYPAILRPHGGPVWAYYAELHASGAAVRGQRLRCAVSKSRAALPATGRHTRRRLTRIGATRIFRTIWPWSTMPLRRAWLIPTSSAWGDGRTAESRPISSLPRPRASRPPFQAPAAHSLPRSTDMTSTSGIMKPSWDIPGKTGRSGTRSRLFTRSRISPLRLCSWEAILTRMCRSWEASRCIRH